MLAAIDLLSVTLGLLLGTQAPPGTPPWINNPRTIVEAVAEHAAAGFFVGMATLNLRRALIGAAFQPLVDVDHVTAYLNLPVDPRIGHSFFVLVMLILVVSSLRMWPWGSRDFGLFASAQFAVHLAVAPPGFPLLAPFVPTTYYFPVLFPATIGVLLALLNLALSRRTAPREPPSSALGVANGAPPGSAVPVGMRRIIELH